MRYARVINNTVVEVFQPQPGFTLEESFHPDLAAQFEPVAGNVEVGFLRQEDSSFEAPPAPTDAAVLENNQ